MRAAGLKFNDLKFILGIKEIPYLAYVETWEGIKSDMGKLQGIVDIRRPSTTTEVRALIGVVQYYRFICPRWSHILSPITKADSGPKGRKVLWNNALEESFKKLKRMVSAKTLLSYPDWNIPFMVHTYDSDKELGDVISQNNKPISLSSRILINPQRNYTTNNK